MTPEDYYERGKKLLADAEGAFDVGKFDLARAEAALAGANFEAAPLQQFLARGGANRVPFDDPRELRAWCVDRAIGFRGFLRDGEEIEQLLDVAERIRAYVATGEQPEPGATDG